MQRYIVIIPAFNEASSISIVINGLRESKKDSDILVVNDGSKDRTAEIAKGLGVMVISHPYNLGYGAALQTGYRFAISRAYDHIIIMDADGQHDPQSISNLFKSVEDTRADVVIGSRFLDGSYRMELTRRIGSRVFSRVASLYTGYRFTDPTSGFQLLSYQACSFLASEETHPMDYPDVNVIMLLHKKRFKVVEAPVRMVNKIGGNTMHRGLKPIIYVIRMLLSITIILLRRRD